jgi:hypothetical protein
VSVFNSTHYGCMCLCVQYSKQDRHTLVRFEQYSPLHVHDFRCVCVCVCVCVRARACVRACARACVRANHNN